VVAVLLPRVAELLALVVLAAAAREGRVRSAALELTG